MRPRESCAGRMLMTFLPGGDAFAPTRPLPRSFLLAPRVALSLRFEQFISGFILTDYFKYFYFLYIKGLGILACIHIPYVAAIHYTSE